VLLLVLSPATAEDNRARESDPVGELKKLFEAGSKSTPSAIAAAKAHYVSLKQSHSADARIDYAYALVLVNQHQYHDAIPLLTGYLETAKPPLCAYFVKMWAQIPLHTYADVLEQARALADRFPRDATEAPEKKYSEAAHYLGAIFAYLQLVHPTALDSALRTEEKKHVLAQLGKSYQPTFEEGYNAVAKRLGELQAQEKSRLESRKEQDQSAAEEAQIKSKLQEEKIQNGEQHFEEIQKEYSELQKQIVPLLANRQALQDQMVQAQLQVTTLTRLPGDANSFQIEATRRIASALERQLREMDRQLAPFNTRARQLETRAAQENITLARTSAQVRKYERIGADAEKRLHHDEAKLHSHPAKPDAKIPLFSTYLPLPYEQEQRRILSWFSN
jgi:hypothetical protein